MSGLLTLSNLTAWTAQTTCLVAAALSVLWAVRLSDSSLRYAFLRAVLAACLLLPLAGTRTESTEQDVSTDISGPALASSPASPDSGHGLMDLAGTVPASGVLLLFAGGTLIRLAWMALGIARLRRLRRAGEIAQGDEAHQELQGLVGARAVIRHVADLPQPVTFGHWRPVVLLPDSLRDRPAAIRRAVLAHELWHVRRHDWAWTVAEESLRAVLWFHPAIWILLSRIQSCREEVVDELAILTTGSRRSYAEALIVCADHTPLVAATAFARRRHLVHRLTLISREAVMSGKRMVAACVILAALTMSAGWYAVLAFPLTRVQDAGVMSTVTGPMEERAKPLTPENPVPARTRQALPVYPRAAADAKASGVLTLRVTVDESGRVAEVRLVGAALSLYGGRFSLSGPAQIERAGDAMLNGQPVGMTLNGQPVRPVLEALATSAGRAVQQWQYDAPVDGPIAFDVTVAFSGPRPQSPVAGATSPRPGPMPAAPTSTPDAAAASIDSGALRVGGNIPPPTKIKHVYPEYPPVAREAQVQGVVIMEARIEADGTVGQTRVLRSIPLLDAAAMDAVRQWQFTPTLLNGAPVPIVMTVALNFSLQ